MVWRLLNGGIATIQLPSRSNEFGDSIDRFSAWVIYLSLAALVHEPSLWVQLRGADDEHLLLAEEDFKNPANSLRFPMLLNHPVAEIRALADTVRGLSAAANVAAIPEFRSADVLMSADAVPNSAAPAGENTFTAPAGLPDWMADHLSSTKSVEHVDFGDQGRLLQIFGGLTLLLLVSVLVLGLAGPLELFPIEAAAAGGFLTTWCVGVVVAYRRCPEFQKARPLRARVAEMKKSRETEMRELAQAGTGLERHAKAEAKRNAADQAKKERVHRQHRDAQLRCDKDLQRRLSQLGSARANLVKSKQAEVNWALASIRDSYVQARLRGVRVTEAELNGFGPKLISRLQGAGILAAADFVKVRFLNDGSRDFVGIVLRDGRQVSIPGWHNKGKNT